MRKKKKKHPAAPPGPALPQLSAHLAARPSAAQRRPRAAMRDPTHAHVPGARSHHVGDAGDGGICVCVCVSLPASPGCAQLRTFRQGTGGATASILRGWGWPRGAPRCAGGRGVPGVGRAVPEGAGLTLRSAGNSSFFTSPVAAAMLPAPEKAASPSWDACSFAFSATARAGGSASVPPLPAQGGRREALGRIRPSPPACPGAGEGRGPGRRSAAGHGARAAPQILCCGPCYIRGFSRVTSAPSISP